MDGKFKNHIDVLAERPNALENKSIGLDDVTSFDELYTIIRKEGEIESTTGKYTHRQIIHEIDEIRNGERDPNKITRSYGIRKNVIRLLSNDSQYLAALRKGKIRGKNLAN